MITLNPKLQMPYSQVGALKMKAAKGGPWIYDLT